MTIIETAAAEIIETEFNCLSGSSALTFLRTTITCDWTDDEVLSVLPVAARDADAVAAVRAAYPGAARARLAAIKADALDAATRCEDCRGTGVDRIPWDNCRWCRGTGVR